MFVSDKNVSVICLSYDEICKIADSLEIAYHECRDMKAGALFTQFETLKESLDSKRNQILD